MDQVFIESLPDKMLPFTQYGKVADYIPALKQIPNDKFGIAVSSVDGKIHHAGDSQEQFSVQSISKVFAIIMGLRIMGDEFWSHIGLQLSAKTFNSITPIEESEGRPRNPFTNGGAIAVVDLLLSHRRSYLEDLLSFLRSVTQNKNIVCNREVARSEKETGYRNFAIAQFLKSYDILQNDVNEVLEAYFAQCAIAMTCIDLSGFMLFLANGGVDPKDGSQILTPLQCKRLNAIMLMFGTYEAAGDFAFKIGLPGKSGVGGGISVIVPGEMSIAVWSPALDEFGTSVAGLKALEVMVESMGISIF